MLLSLNKSRFSYYLHIIDPNKFAVKDITDTQRSVSYLDIYLEIDNKGRLKAKLHFSNSQLPSLAISQQH
jgi:hypothetical protein